MPRNRNKLLLFLVALVFLAFDVQILPLIAKTIPPGQVNISTPVYVPADSFNPQMGKYSYEVSWNGIPAGSIALELDRSDGDFKIRTSARTAKGIDIVYKLRYESEAILAADTLKTKHSISVTWANSRKKSIEIEFLPDGEIVSIRKNRNGREKTLKFNPGNFTLDPFSAGLLALSQDWKIGDSRQFDMFSGKSRYLVELSAVEQTEVSIDNKTRSAIVLLPTVKELTGVDNDDKTKKMRQARIYISADQPHEILKISSDLLFGSVNMEMVGFTPRPQPAPEVEHKSKKVPLGIDENPPSNRPVVIGECSVPPVQP